jgi:hypothetical protein
MTSFSAARMMAATSSRLRQIVMVVAGEDIV